MSKPVILAVDDTAFVLDSIKSGLSSNYEVVACESGKEGLDYLADNHVDLVLLDYDMPGMTGFEVLMNIQTLNNNRHVPVIFLTGVTNIRMEQEMMERGARDYIRKPIDFTVLRERINKLL
jgi:response regulator RpfG family c-di-GMP phosphodiesterase